MRNNEDAIDIYYDPRIACPLCFVYYLKNGASIKGRFWLKRFILW